MIKYFCDCCKKEMDKLDVLKPSYTLQIKEFVESGEITLNGPSYSVHLCSNCYPIFDILKNKTLQFTFEEIERLIFWHRVTFQTSIESAYDALLLEKLETLHKKLLNKEKTQHD